MLISLDGAATWIVHSERSETSTAAAQFLEALTNEALTKRVYCFLGAPQTFIFTSDKFPTLVVSAWLIFTFTHRLNYLFSASDKRNLSSAAYNAIMSRLKQPTRDSETRKSFIEWRSNEIRTKKAGLFRKILNFALVFALASRAMRTSFLWELVWLSFALVYGLASVIESWVSLPSIGNNPGLKEEFGTLGFGQLVALFLLVLPILAAVQTYIGRARILRA